MRVSANDQDLTRQKYLVDDAKKAGYYIAGTYAEKASGVSSNRPKLLQLIEDLQEGDVVIAEHLDRITRLPLVEAEALINAIKAKGAILSIPGIVDFTDLINQSEGLSKIVLAATQDLLLKIALFATNDEWAKRQERQRQGVQKAQTEGKYKGRAPNRKLHAEIIELREHGFSISKTALKLGCSKATVTNVMAAQRKKEK